MSSAAETVEQALGDGLDDVIRGVGWERLQRIQACPEIFTDWERGYARQVADIFDAIDLGGDVSREVRKLTYGCLAWAVVFLEVVFLEELSGCDAT